MQQALLLISAIASVLAVLPVWPYAYYVLLRLLVFVACVTFLYASPAEQRRDEWALVILAILFNPVLPIHLSRTLWLPINLAAAWALFAAYRRQGAGEPPH